MDPGNKTIYIKESELEPLSDKELEESRYKTMETECISKEPEESTGPGGAPTQNERRPEADAASPNQKTIALRVISKPPPFPAELKSSAPVSFSGKTIDGRYQICECLGQGAMGAVYEVKHLRLDKLFAMKVIHPHLAKHEKLVARFKREAAALSRLDHPNCVRVTDFGQTPDGDLYLVMEKEEGALLSELVRQGPLRVPDAIEVARQTLLGLSHAHNAGIIHRDIKLENLIKTESEDGRTCVKILDFGLAKEELPSGTQIALTEAGEVLGTPQYIAPESILEQCVNPKTDLYAVGVALFYMLIGRPVFAGSGPVEILQFKLQNPPPMLNDMGCGAFPKSLERFLARALAEPDKRFSSAAEMLEALEELSKDISQTGALTSLLERTKVKQATAVALKYGERVTLSAFHRGKKAGQVMRSGLKGWWERQHAEGKTPWRSLLRSTKNHLKQSIQRLSGPPPKDPGADS
ncbi:MAG: serine/threonine protein kinase [Myxococcota bacterium]|jgi:serine/threonine protein kinase|nr:serine/threonine protein kinase [Myxococcota bacterium]